MTEFIFPQYIFSLAKVTNSITPHNYLALFNPVNSSKTIYFISAKISSTLLTSSSVTDPLRGLRISSFSGGTVQSSSSVSKVRTQFPDPTAQVVTGNPTCTLGSPFFNVPSPIRDKGAEFYSVDFLSDSVGFTLEPGEGLVVRCLVGIGSAATWNFDIRWGED